ncbi:MAG: hypothetical protein A2534_02340 [Candidatus Magasanikbacteria bacterium RIFOXYD2_FULL_39_9]|uniref:Uncharacterized protein n=1 Tax=Candidatus Magasanikbacteria bacterium RIFOXYD1_FULL_40_23 TaxID=1798705 RepID=A0A1F6PBN2_9BACT|nr:MAG: hypothetical protein A2534_02340 [Candidatus Magasanikbacteria bacterium RIFOXYD2_FULL_39_9]OGH93364.1 MAG: hypothetical protein A2563_02020 [Candidatus Magasanikbacteria bacterium RIFOXYD1_FULL_40_23]
MLNQTRLSTQAEKVIEGYLNLPFSQITGVRCPYFNNARLGQRGQLKVLIGKGTPQEILEEAKIIAIQYKQDIFSVNDPEQIRKFLIEHNLGIDCSGFITNVLKAQFAAKGKNLTKQIFITPKRNILRWMISQLRPVEQMNVKVFANDKNTKTITDLKEVEAGDLIAMIDTGPNKNHDHILLVTETDGNVIKYAHARAWSSEGRYKHGVSTGTITINNPDKGLLDQTWEEKDMFNHDNETFWEAKDATILQIRRLKF